MPGGCCTVERCVQGDCPPVPGSPCLPRSGHHCPRGVMSQESELDPHRVPLCSCQSTACILGTERDICPKLCPGIMFSPSTQSVLSPQTHQCHRVWEGFVLGLLKLKLFPKCILIIKLHFRLNKVKEEHPTGHCELPTHCPLPVGSSSSPYRPRHPTAGRAWKHSDKTKARGEVSGKLCQISHHNPCVLSLNTDG